MNSAQVLQECFINAELASMVRIRKASWMLDIEVGRLCCRTEGSLRNASCHPRSAPSLPRYCGCFGAVLSWLDETQGC
jgi:hypothetical protein